MEILRDRRILLVEDCRVHRKLFVKFLEPLKIETVAYGPHAVDLYEKTGDYDLVILDIHMPLMSGFDVFKSLKNRNSQARFIAISADVSEDSMRFAKMLGFHAFLGKPFTREELLGALYRVSGSREIIY